MEQKTKKWLVAGILTVAVAIGVGTCYSNTSDKSDKEKKEAVKDEDNKNVKEAKGISQDEMPYYPLTIKTKGPDGKEYETVYEKQPEKVVAVYQGNVETMLALGLEDKIAAVAGIEQPVLEEYQESFSKLKNLEEFTPSKETITAEEPDMIFSWVSYFEESTLGEPQEWLDQNVNVYINTNTASEKDTLENEYKDIKNIGKIFQVEEKAEKLVKSMKDKIKKIRKKVEKMETKPSVLILEKGTDGFINYGADSLAGDMVNQIGGTLAQEESRVLTAEEVAEANPDVLFITYTPYLDDDEELIKEEKMDLFLQDDTFAEMKVVKSNRVIPVMLKELFASGVRTADGVETLAEGILYNDLSI